MMMKENGVQFQISSRPTVMSARCGSLSHDGLNSIPLRRVMTSLSGPLWYSIISAV